MVSFKKNGRPTKSEKGLLKNINNLLSSFTDDDRKGYDFSEEKVTEGGRLNQIWDILQDSPKKELIEEDKVTVVNDDRVNTSTGEVLDSGKDNIEENIKGNEEQVKFVKEEKKMEDATIIDEIENESNDENSIPTSFNPLSNPIKERTYNKRDTSDVGDIPEPNFGSQASVSEEIDEIDAEREEAEREHEEEVEEEKEKLFDNVTNDAMNDLDSKDKKEAAKQLVETVLDGYAMMHDLGKRLVQYPEEKIQEKIIKEEIDPTMSIPIDEHGNETNVTEFFSEFNEQAAEAISYDPAFGDKVRPAMQRFFADKGWGMTDGQFIAAAFIKDAGWKTVQIITLKKTASNIMDTFVQLQREKLEANQGRPSQAVQPDSIVTPPPTPAREKAAPIYQHEHEEQESEEYEDTQDETGISVMDQ